MPTDEVPQEVSIIKRLQDVRADFESRAAIASSLLWMQACMNLVAAADHVLLMMQRTEIENQ